MCKIPLTKLQKEIMCEFYSVSPTKVAFNKSERDKLWDKAKSRSKNIDFDLLNKKCPALARQIIRSYTDKNNLQSAVFSECVYAQTLADMFGLSIFVDCAENRNFLPERVEALLHSYSLVPRYIYSTPDKKRILIQAGGCNGIDSALITVIDLVIYTIEFKEPGAKTSEPDLPKYKEDGKIYITEKWRTKNSQFIDMIEEKSNLNFFEVMGSNVNDFSQKNINVAVTNNYSNRKKFADVICTEDIDGNLVMFPANQISEWAVSVGEIRPSGRNHSKVWTPNALNRFLIEKNAFVEDGIVTIEKSAVLQRTARGGNGKISGYKINPLFFVYLRDCTENENTITFNLNKIQQLRPTISVKIFFKELYHKNIKTFYNFD